jgi:hypothetical protein
VIEELNIISTRRIRQKEKARAYYGAASNCLPLPLVHLLFGSIRLIPHHLSSPVLIAQKCLNTLPFPQKLFRSFFNSFSYPPAIDMW